MYLGLDIGTSGIKALLIDDAQKIIGSANSYLTVSRPHSGWSEQDPSQWIQATESVMEALKEEHPTEMSAIRGIGLSGQMHGATLLDASHEVLRPCILWNDTRAHQEAAELDSDPRFRALTGNIVFPGFTAPKLNWVKNNEPELFARVSKVLLPKDYLRFWLTGEFFSEMSDASGTAWLDVAQRRWSRELLGATDLAETHMPDLVEGTDVAGILKQDLAAKWGISGQVVVAGGAGDNAASACGMGTVRPGSAFVSLGTSGVLFASNATYSPNANSAVHTFCHALPTTWHQMGVMLSATDSLNWLARITSKSAGDLTQALGETLQSPTGVTFLPYLAGERTPHNDAMIRGSFSGLEQETGAQEMTQAVLEGVAFAFRDNLEALRAAGTDLQSVTAIGGGSRSHYWLKAIATALNIPVEVPADGDFGAAFGAARLGLIAATSADPLAVCVPPQTERVIEPDTALRPAFEEAYSRYQRLYPALSSV